ncbi:DUF305 domain-containing protein [Actinoplanes ianthinogenes]|uniref:DUF305 domain-containing protein n=2 Tax=Actinoplanes ianthinogenes TaxID=122358 RepID=A0ABM7LVP9_9ACTN|nr:DUF305 domain-containing protein [Actinoplanes ianthinogenes]GGR20402.1 DUF305 domain-containing protein [Actinoplanes ianthinogenes]
MKRGLVAVALLLAVGGCGTAASPAPAPSAPAAPAVKNVAEITAGSTFNERDVMFLQMLVDHQQQGLEMAAIGAQRATRADVADLAKAVSLTETDELTMMKNWLTEWGKPTTVDKRVSVHADHGGLPSTTDTEITSLKTVKKKDFETAFLNLFLAHQHNAVEMAQLELDKGANEQTKQFAERVKQSRADQVQQMLRLLNG